MKFLQNRAVALVLAALVVTGSTALNVNRNLAREAESAQTLWTEHNGVAEQLALRASNAAQLWSVTRSVPALESESAALREAYNALYDAQEAGDVAALAAANDALTAAAAAMETAMAAALGADELALAQRYAGLVANAGRVIDVSGYNDAVAGYYAVARAFPLNWLQPLLWVEEPAYFAAS